MRMHVLVLVLVGCGERTVPDDERAPFHDMGGGADQPDSEGEVLCREGLIACEGVCIDPSSSDEHCGACDHACKDPYWSGHCQEGSCPSAHWCATLELQLQTCDEVCAYFGQRCDEGPPLYGVGCGGGYVLYFEEFTRSALQACETRVGSDRGITATCSTSIDWSIRGGWESKAAGAVACCCTQELEP